MVTKSIFLCVHEGHAHALFRNNKHLRLDGPVCFYRWLFPMLSNHEGGFHGLCGPTVKHGIPYVLFFDEMDFIAIIH